jgi:sulfotransferase family protein
MRVTAIQAEKAEPVPGPIVIVGRPHSGSRWLTQACLASGIFMGADLTPTFLDSLSWYQRFVVPLMLSRFFPTWEDQCNESSLRRLCLERLQDTLPRYCAGGVLNGPWGWKYCETLFVMPLIKLMLPGTRFVHIVRDGRDVALSDEGFFQLTGDHRDPDGWDPPAVGGVRPRFREFCVAATFGENGVRTWKGLDLEDRRVLVANRFLFQMHSWVTCVTRAAAYGALFPEDYLEVRYEDLCHDPVDQARRLFAWLRIPLRPQAISVFQKQVTPARIGKWRTCRMTVGEMRDFEKAVDHGRLVLNHMGYRA